MGIFLLAPDTSGASSSLTLLVIASKDCLQGIRNKITQFQKASCSLGSRCRSGRPFHSWMLMDVSKA